MAVLTQYLDRSDGGYEYVLRRAFATACRRRDFDLVVVCGEALDDPRAENLPKNQIYRLLDHEAFDAAILLTAGLAAYCGPVRLMEHFAHLRGMALCSLGTRLEGVPSVIADNQSGMTQLVEHVVLVHARKHLAFLGSLWENEEIDLRREAVLEACERLGVSIQPARMLGAGLESVSAEAATARLLDQDPEVDAIIAANDGSAIGALRALEKRGVGVQERMIVTGYDDIPLAQLLGRPLSTVRQPIVRLAEAAVELVARQLDGQPVPWVTELPTELVLRASCGCEWVPASQRIAPEALPRARQLATLPRDSSLPQDVEPTIALRARLAERIDIENTYVQVLETVTQFSRSLDLTDLELKLMTYLPTIHASDLFLNLYTDSTKTRFRRVMRLSDGRVSDSSGALLAANGTALTELCGVDEPRVAVVLALTSRDSMLGIIGFHVLDGHFDYLLLRDQVASSLQVVHLHDEVLRQTMVSERHAQERQAAADRSNALAALAGGVAHDLNNALGSLVALTDVVYDEVDACLERGQSLNPEVRSDLLTMKSGALRAAETVKDLMTLGRIGRTRHEPFDIGHLAHRLVEQLRESACTSFGKQVNFTCAGSQEHLVVVGSEPHVERAIGNLLRNAVEAVAPGGQIEVSVSVEQLLQPSMGFEAIPPGVYAVITVQDHGIGIESDHLRRVFEPFFSTKRLGEDSGSGLGLAIVHSVAKEHQGFVDVSSTPGVGSRFSLFLPRVSSPPEAPYSVVPVATGSARILVVDDDLTQLRTAKRVLTRLGYDVMTTTSGASAVDILRDELEMQRNAALAPSRAARGFDLVILDFALSEDEDGLAVFRRIREAIPAQRGILASGHAFLDHEQEIREAGLVWLPKPYTVESLSYAIQQSLRPDEPSSSPNDAT